MSFGETLAVIFIVAAVVIGIIFLIKRFFYKKEKSLTGVTVTQSLHNIGVLETSEYVFTRVDVFDSSKRLGKMALPLTQSKVIFSYTGRVIAGIDLLGATVEETESSITVSLPKAQIRSVELFEDTFKVYDEHNSIFNVTSFKDYNDSTSTFKEKGREEACQYGLLERADANAKLMIEHLIKALPAAKSKEILIKEKTGFKVLAGGKTLNQ